MKESLSAKTLWLIPLCGGNPLHWILGWLDFANNVFGIFDSIPELQSYFWAEPVCKFEETIHDRLLTKTNQLFLEVADKILETIGSESIEWDRWTRLLSSPGELQRQMDGWSCGIFVMLAMKLSSMGETLANATNDRIPDTRNDVLRLLLQETQ